MWTSEPVQEGMPRERITLIITFKLLLILLIWASSTWLCLYATIVFVPIDSWNKIRLGPQPLPLPPAVTINTNNKRIRKREKLHLSGKVCHQITIIQSWPFAQATKKIIILDVVFKIDDCRKFMHHIQMQPCSCCSKKIQ